MQELKSNQLLRLIDSRFHPYIKGDEFTCKQIDPRTIDFTKRVDILVKVKLIESYVAKDFELFNYYKGLYLKTISLFTDGSFIEPGDSNKKSESDYVSKFLSLYESIKNNGFNFSDGVIPFSHGIPLDGAHRIAIAYVIGLQLPIVELDINPVDYGIKFFSERAGDDEIDAELVELTLDFYSDIRLAVIWPKASLDLNEVKALFKTSLIFYKSLKLNENGLNNLCISAYKDEAWSGDASNQWAGSWAKSSLCYSDSDTTIVLFRPEFSGQDIEIKNSLREKNDGSKHCMHSTDYPYDTRNLSKCTFFRRSELYLNRIQLSELSALKKQIAISGEENDLIVGSSFMSVLGIRESNDIDTLNIDGKGSHNEYINYYSGSVRVLGIKSVYYFLGVKFLDLDEIKKFKIKRAEKKDTDDLKLIDSFFNNELNSINSILLVNKRKFMQSIQSNKRRTILASLNVLKSIGIYNFIRKIYHFCR
ncbi:hypothetical protein P0I94_002580 [Vibrio vulnificus]|uniref:hypothetical protein n=1 Tax=Vibrio vulnificus TaxID=672 RepID=UPI001CDD3DDF|nr:hypothetical protein [Vibrio vulnificus]EKO5170322.1 hypothetical protein [Vibrio vulnificus]MCA3940604.1 hypothetical protein [Vibrio vulnificus]